MSTSKIGWTFFTWNPLTGCQYVSEGCRNCYAATMTKRLEAMGQPKYQGLIGNNHFNGNIKIHHNELDRSFRRKPMLIFVNSMSDLFHKSVPFEFISQVLDVMIKYPQHIFQVLTKRPEIALKFSEWYGKKFPKNMWMGTSVETQETAEERHHYLSQIEAAHLKWWSAQPLLGSIDCQKAWKDKPVDWVVIGVESKLRYTGRLGLNGSSSEKIWLDWAGDIVDQCNQSEVTVSLSKFQRRVLFAMICWNFQSI